jgi:hypothetical protein
MSKPLKAYAVTETTEGTGGIVYAKTNAQARREGSCQFGDGDFHGWECRRAPEFDSMAPHGPSREDLFEHGWWFECEECSSHARLDSGGIAIAGGFYCWEHADFYVWREPPTHRPSWQRDDYVWMPTARWAAPIGPVAQGGGQ